MTLDKVRYSLPPLQRQPSWCNWCKPGMLLSNHYNYTQQPIFRIGWYHITWTWRDTDNGESLNTSFRPEKDERLVHHVILSYPSARWYAHMSLRWGGPNEAHLLIQLDRLFNGWKATQLWISRFVTLRQEWIILDMTCSKNCYGYTLHLLCARSQECRVIACFNTTKLCYGNMAL